MTTSPDSTPEVHPEIAAQEAAEAAAGSVSEAAHQQIIDRLAREMSLTPMLVRRTLELFADGSTIPFVARYRKELTGGMDEVRLAQVVDRFEELEALEKRRAFVLKTVGDQGKLTAGLRSAIEAAPDLKTLEDLYLPFKPRRRTRAQKAREAGIEPLAERLLAGDEAALQESFDTLQNSDFPDKEAVLSGARDIIAERVSEDAAVRDDVRECLRESGRIATRKGKKAAEDTEGKYDALFDLKTPVDQLPGHRMLALNRAENEGILTYRVDHDAAPALRKANARFAAHARGACAQQIGMAIDDSYQRLLVPSLEAELRRELKEDADAEAIDVFASNLYDLLMQPPLGEHAVLGIDPGYRTGCKVALIDPHGEFVDSKVIYPHPPQSDVEGAKAILHGFLQAFGGEFEIRYCAYGNGTASRETGRFLKEFGKELKAKGKPFDPIQVNESGASVYSASEIAREEFPDLDLTVRGAISIARRLQDPLAELIKTDPKAIGVGQYQHDVDQKKLAQALTRVVETCVNRVGVDVNTASWKLLTYVSGLSERLAKAIIKERTKLDGFSNREQLLKVSGMGPKAYEQCAGFLRIRGGDNILDATAVHPERYALVARICQQAGIRLADAVQKPEVLANLNPRDFVNSAEGVGLPTIEDILHELRQPGRDPRGGFESFEYDESVQEITDLKPGMELPGIVTNITKFGCFVDIGVHQDGLVHISELANRYVADPSEEVSVGQKVRVKVLQVEAERKRIGLSIKQADQG